MKNVRTHRDKFSKWVNAYPFYANIEREGIAVPKCHRNSNSMSRNFPTAPRILFLSV